MIHNLTSGAWKIFFFFPSLLSIILLYELKFPFLGYTIRVLLEGEPDGSRWSSQETVHAEDKRENAGGGAGLHRGNRSSPPDHLLETPASRAARKERSFGHPET